MHDFIIIGGGIYGITVALELAKRKYKVGLLNPDTIPHHLAASTDISKAVRMEYGSDKEYFKMVEICIDGWRDWNDLFKETLYCEVGFLLMVKDSIESDKNPYEKHSYQNLLAAGYHPERLNAKELKEKFPAVNITTYKEALFNSKAGYVKSGKVVEKLADYARSLNVDIYEGQTAEQLVIKNGQLQAVKTKEGQTFSCGHAIVAAGAHTPLLLPELQPYMKPTGHPIFWLQPLNPTNFRTPKLSVFGADIATSGWYGFPLHPDYGVVKIGKHAKGLSVHPDKGDRQVKDAEVKDMRQFLKNTFPELANAPLVYTRRCLYTDTLDGHFWIDNHPEIKGLSVSSGGSGHGMKMAPLLGPMAADIAEGKSHQFSKRYRWRHLSASTLQQEEARAC